MARPKKEFPPRKEKQITIRMTEDLYEVITTNAKNARLPRTEYIRELILDNKPVIHYEIVFDNPEILKALQKIGNAGNNMNQIARHLNQGGEMTKELIQEIRKCISCIYEIRDDVQKVAGKYRGKFFKYNDY